MSDPAPNFEGHEGRECGEHRTVGSHRAWCHDCTEWCYPELPCRGCKIPQLEASLTEANKLLEQTIEVLEGLATAIDFYFVHEDGEGEKRARGLYESRQAAHALLDNLKALKKEATE